MIKRTAFILSFILGLACASRGQVQMLFTADSLSYITSPLGIDSLFYWFDASQGVTDSLGGAIATDEGVGTWEDLSPNGYDVAQDTNGLRPVWKATGGPASKPCIQFDGSNDMLRTITAHWWGSDDITMFFVVKFNAANTNQYEGIIHKVSQTSDAQFQVYYFPDLTGTYRDFAQAFVAHKNALVDYKTWEASTGVTPTIVKSTSYFLSTIVSNGSGTVSIYLDGVSKSTNIVTLGSGDGTIANNNTAKIGIGGRRNAGASSNFLKGSLSELIVYSKALSAAEQSAIENYLNKKYDLY